MAIPKYNEMYLAFLKTLQDGEIHTMKEAKESVTATFSVDGKISELLPCSKQRIFDNLNWMVSNIS